MGRAPLIGDRAWTAPGSGLAVLIPPLAVIALVGCASAPRAPTPDEQTAALAGTVLLAPARADAAARPLPGVRLQLRLASGAVQEAASDEQGRFEMTLLEPGAARLRWCGGGREAGERDEALQLEAGRRALLQLQLRPARAPAPSCAELLGPVPWKAEGTLSADAAVARALEPERSMLPVKGAPPLKETKATLRGSVADARGAPLASARVQVRRSGEELLVRETSSGADGRFELAGLPPHRYDVEVAATEGESAVSGLWLGPGAVRDLPVRFGARRGQVRISGRVLGPGGAPAAARVGAVGSIEGQHAAVAYAEAPSSPEAVHTGADGRFALSVAEPGERSDGAGLHRFFATGAAGALVAVQHEALSPGQAGLARDLVLAGLGKDRCAGRVLLDDGKPAAGATVRASRGDDDRPREGVAVSATDGAFEVACPSAGASLTAQQGGLRARVELGAPAAGLELRLAPGATLRLKTLLRPPVRRVSARLAPRLGPPDRIRSSPPLAVTETTGEPFDVEALPIGGPIDLEIHTDDGRAAAATVVLPGPGIWEAELPVD